MHTSISLKSLTSMAEDNNAAALIVKILDSLRVLLTENSEIIEDPQFCKSWEELMQTKENLKGGFAAGSLRRKRRASGIVGEKPTTKRQLTDGGLLERGSLALGIDE